jgi:voltage-gated potassium channel Kch
MLWELVLAFSIVAVCLVLHVASIVVMGDWLLDQRDKRAKPIRGMGYIVLLVITFSAIIVLHMIETAIWASFYYVRGLFPDFETSLYFSITSYTTIGFGDVVLPRAWRMLGGIEGISGVLLCGLSTAFVFAIVNALFQMRLQRRNPPQQSRS